jgi:hypothetical protein
MNTFTTISPLPPKKVKKTLKCDVVSYVTSKSINGEFQRGAPKMGEGGGLLPT